MRNLYALIVCAALGACEPQPAPALQHGPDPEAEAPVAQDETLSLRPVEDDALAVELVYHRRPEQVAPRMMELWLTVGDGLAFRGATPSAALERAGKEVVVQPQGDTLRIVVYAADNLTTLDTGVLARLRFARTSGSDTRLTLESRLPIFAPAAANDGLMLAAPLDLAGASR